MKCKNCTTYKKADNCQKCFTELQSDYWLFISKIREMAEIVHISSLDKIIEELRHKKEEIRNFPLKDYKRSEDE